MLEHFCHDEFIILYSLLITFSLLFCRSKLWRRAKCFAILNSLVGSSQLRFWFLLEYFYYVCMCWMRGKDFLLCLLLFPSPSTYSFSSLSLYVKYLLCKSLFIYLFLFCLFIFFPPVWCIWGGHQDSTRGWWWVWRLWMSFYCWVFLQISLHMFSFGLLCFTDPVGYGDALIAILPSFPGIKMLHWFGQTFSCSFHAMLCSYTLQALYASSLYHFQLKMKCLSFRIAIVWAAYRFSDYIEDKELWKLLISGIEK